MTKFLSRDQEKTGVPQLSPPETRPEGDRSASRTSVIILVITFFMLLGGAGLVLFPADEKKSDKLGPPPGQPPISDESTTSPQANLADSDAALAEATSLLETLLALKVRAESEAVSSWASATYQTILDTVVRGDAFFADKKYPETIQLYQIAISELTGLLESKSEVFQTAMDNGKLALYDENREDAIRYFSKALAIMPSSIEVKDYLNKAESLDAVTRMYHDASFLEQSGKLREATAKLEEALALYPDYLPAKNKHARIGEKIKQQAFQDEMSQFLISIEEGDLNQARKSFQRMREIDGDHPQVEQAGRVLSEREEAYSVNSLRQKAEQQSRAENWKEALSTFESILSIAPEALFAVMGRKNAAKRLDLDTTLRTTIDHPQRLRDVAQKDGAEQLLSYARQITPKGPRLQSQIATLDAAIVMAGTVIPVTLESDNITEITIFHVGRMGHFLIKQIGLKPGIYTVVGSRPGYRDIRKSIEVNPEEQIHRFAIRCEEPI